MLKKGRPRSATIPENYWGLHYSHATQNGFNPVVPYIDIGQKSLRLWDTRCKWYNVEPSKGNFNWTDLDYFASRGLDLIYCLGGAAAWANGTGPTSGNSPDPPTNNQDWVDFITAVATRYPRSIISAYEIWNEPNVSKFYNGTVARLIELHQLAYTTLKAIDPEIIVVSASPSMTDAPNYTDRMLKAGVANYCDVIATHCYVMPAQPETLLDTLNRTRASMAAHGVSKPIWNTEFTQTKYVGPDGTLYDDASVSGPMQDDLAVSYIVRFMLLASMGGAERSWFYGVDYNFNKVALIDWDNTSVKTDAALAYANLVTLMTGGSVSNLSVNDTLHRLSITDGAGRVGYVFYCQDYRSQTVNPAELGVTSLFDPLGDQIEWEGEEILVTHVPVFGFCS